MTRATAIISPSPVQDAQSNQRQAINPQESVWVTASAGSGKTSVLTTRVLNLLLHGAAPQKLLCLTYTKAAAAEMAERIAKKLGNWATCDETTLEKELDALLYVPVDIGIMERARTLFAYALETPGGLKIQTIHSFCQSILQRFPLEADIPPNFDIIDERASEELLDDCLAKVLRDYARHDAGPLNKIGRYIGGEERLKKAVREFIQHRPECGEMLSRHGTNFADAIFARLGISPGASESGILNAACSAAAMETDKLRAAAAAMQKGNENDAERGAALLSFLNAGEERRRALWKDYKTIFLTQKNTVKALRNIATKAAVKNDPEIEFILLREGDRILKAEQDMNAAFTAEHSVLLTQFALRVISQYQQRKLSRNYLDYNDLIMVTRRLLQQEGIASWVLFKLDGGIDHLLIDEAQDTSPEQWDIIRALSEEFQTGLGARDTVRTMFGVGDPKQSIFSFQRADPRGFTDSERYFSARTIAAKLSWKSLSLSMSFRSAPEVLEFVDAVFTATKAKEGVAADGRYAAHRAVRDSVPGYVALWPLVPKEKPEEVNAWESLTTMQNDYPSDVKLAYAIADEIDSWLKQGKTLPENHVTGRKAKKIEPGDIMILLRQRGKDGRLMNYIVRALKRRGVPVAGVDRLLLQDHIAIQDIIALLKFMLLPEDDLNLACLLKSPLLELDEFGAEKLIFTLSHNRGEKRLWENLQALAERDAGAARVYLYLRPLFDKADQIPIYELLHDILIVQEGRKKLVARLGHECLDAIEELMNLALAHEREHGGNLQKFLLRLEEDEFEIKRDLEQAGQSEVRIMTVHAAKGLQAPIVFLPDTTAVPRNKDVTIWDEEASLPFWVPKSRHTPHTDSLREASKQKMEQEYRRLLYVALTRAEDRLYICGFGDAKENSWYDFLLQSFTALMEKGMAKKSHLNKTHLSQRGFEGDMYSFGSDHTAPVTQAEARQSGTPKRKPDWLRQEPPADPAPPTPLTPSRPAEDPPLASPLLNAARADATQAEAIQRGNLIHLLLEKLPSLPQEKRGEVARHFLSQYYGTLSEALRGEIAGEALAVLDNPEFAPFFAPSSRAEVPVTGIVEGRIISGQIDRLNITADAVYILDYKTNRPPPERVENTPQSYIRQLGAYAALMQKAYPAKRIEAGILWTNIPRLHRVPLTRLKPYLLEKP